MLLSSGSDPPEPADRLETVVPDPQISSEIVGVRGQGGEPIGHPQRVQGKTLTFQKSATLTTDIERAWSSQLGNFSKHRSKHAFNFGSNLTVPDLWPLKAYHSNFGRPPGGGMPPREPCFILGSGAPPRRTPRRNKKRSQKPNYVEVGTKCTNLSAGLHLELKTFCQGTLGNRRPDVYLSVNKY